MSDEIFDPAALAVPDLDEAFAARVLRLARGELAGGLGSESGGARLPRLIRQALVPALLLSAGACRTALTVEELPRAYVEPGADRP